MAPEMILKQPYLKSVDIWSCGIIAYMLINKKHPFWEVSESRNTFIESVLRYNPPFTSMNRH
jgi:serine/threonine protein kinase